MATLNLTGQEVERVDINPKIVKLKNLMDQRKPIWDKISPEKRKQWVLSDKDPIMSLAWSVFKYLKSNFFGEDYNDNMET